jgi:flagellar biosynthesis protein FlhA
MKRASSIAIPAFVVGSILMMVIPVPAAVLDLFLVANISVAILVLLGVMLLKDNMDYSVFPSLLLVTTLVRLALNVSSTRLVLLHGYAGEVIQTFGHFVIGGSVVVGLIVFMILIVIQAAVITNGAGRVAEVAARFTLDAMPGKQMAIDADLTSGLIDETEARKRRARISKEADFYGAMDGASKFVKGDVMAGIVITTINLLGGFAIGVGQKGMSFGEAINTYSLLAVGDGLVSQIPALLISIATGLLVTRVGTDENLGDEMTRQMFASKKVLRFAAAIIGGMAILPGFPKIPFLLAAAALFVAGSRQDKAVLEAVEPDTTVTTSPDDPEALVSEMRVEPLELDLAFDILDLIDTSRGGDLLERVRSLRRQIAMELGIVMPYVRTRDDVTLPPSTYRVLVHGVEMGRGDAPRDHVLALPVGDGSELAGLGGTETVEPVFGLAAWWVPEAARGEAAATGATVVDRSSVIVTHMAEVVRRHAGRLLSRQDVQLLVDGLRYDEPLLANEVGGDWLPLGTLHVVLRNLLDDVVCIRDLGRIVETVSDRSHGPRGVEALVGACRVSLAPAIVAKIAPQSRLAVIALEPGYEASLHEGLREIDGETRLLMDPDGTDHLHQEVQSLLIGGNDQGLPIAIVCGQGLRRPLHRLLRALGVDVEVLAYPELPANLTLATMGVIGHARVDA